MKSNWSHKIRRALGVQLVMGCAAMSTALFATRPLVASVATFDDVVLSGNFDNGNPGGLAPGEFHDGSFTSGGLGFNNKFTQGNGFSFWSGWVTSKVNDLTTPGLTNEFAAYSLPDGEGDGSSQYGIAFGGSATIIAPAGETFQSMRITNTTYAAISMLQGDAFAKRFGGTSGEEKDFFKLIITGKSGGVGGAVVGSIDFYLADYRFDDNSQDYLVDQWTAVDLAPLAGADTLSFSYASSDVGTFGINTPTYFAADNIVTVVPEPSSAMLLLGASLLTVGLSRRKQANP